MSSLEDLLRTSVPYRPRLRSDMPLLEWVETYNKEGFVTIPVYISSKKDENPEGYKLSKVKTMLFNGYTAMPQNERQLVQSTFVDAYFCVITDADNLRQCVVLNKDLVSVFKKAGNSVKPLLPKTPNPSKTVNTSSDAENVTVTVEAGQDVATTQPSKKSKSRKK